MAHEETLPPGHYAHFEPEQAYHASKFGMWLFLATEVHLFGALFACFAIYRWHYFEEFNRYAQTLNWKLGALNTLVLLTSSYTMVRGVDAAQKGLNKKVKLWIELTALLSIVFFIVKAIEYSEKFSHHIYPSTHIFYGIYFTMTGVHAFHVLCGLFVMIWLWVLAKKDRFSTVYYTPVEVFGLYWHLVDIIWIFLFPVLYLLGGIGPGAHH